MRSFLGEDFLSGNSACRWYINPDDPRANNLVASFADRIKLLALIVGTTEPARPRVLANQIEHKTLAQLDALSPYQFPSEGFIMRRRAIRCPTRARYWH